MDSNLAIINKSAVKLADDAASLADKLQSVVVETANSSGGVDPFIYAITIFVLACFVGYYVVWKVTPALHTPLMAVTNAISGIIIVGAIIAVGPEDFDFPQFTGFLAVILASINIFGGFIVTHRMLDMFRKK
jgi:NAD(P) transhydrogenase subunit alpha